MSRPRPSRFLAAFAVAVPILAAGAAIHAQGGGRAAAQAAPEVRNPYLPAPYRLVPNWPPPDPGVKWGAIYAAEPDAQGNLWVAHRGSPPIVKLDPQSGKVLAGFGTGMYAALHGLRIDPDGNIFVTDCPGGRGADEALLKAGKGYQVVKMSPNGTVLMTLGQAGVSKAGLETFVCPTDVAVAPNGDIFITDGHDATPRHYGDRVAKFSKDGKFIRDIAQQGSGPGQVWEPHRVVLDSAGRLFVADRSNNRIQILDEEGRFIDLWRQFSRPGGLFIDRKTDTIYVSDANSSPQNHPGWLPGVRVGSAKTGAVTFFIPDSGGEGVAVDAQGNIYVCITEGVLQKYERVGN